MPAKSVLIARNDIQRGQLLKPEDMSWEPWPEGGIDKNYVLMGTKTPDSFSGWVARLPITAGEPISETKIVAPGNRGFLAAVLRPGTRAVTVPVNTTSGIAGFIFPGDQVDLIVTYSVAERPAPGVDNPGPVRDLKISETVLRDIRVIGIDQKLDNKSGEVNPNLKNATLEVTPKQSEIIALASDMGKLSLSLRSLVPGPGEARHEIDQSLVDAASTPLSETYTLDSDISPLLRNPLQKVEAKEPAVPPVTILRGNQGSTVSVAAQPKAGG
jgi:pilus assembly protein CpaB